MNFEFEGEVISWRGPAPFVFAKVPPNICVEIKAVSAKITYGWGVIPTTVTIGETTFKTSLFPREGIYLVPIKVAVQKAEAVEIGQTVKINLCLELKI